MSSINFTCDVCGREVMGCTFVNGMKFCAKCYQETFGNKNNMTENLNNMYDAYSKILAEKDAKISDLEAKLAESEKMNKILYNENESAEKILRMSSDEQTREILKLKQQLAEKEQTITTLIEDSKASKELLKKELAEKEKEIEKLKEIHIVESPIDWKEVHKVFREFSLGEVDMLKLEYPDKFHNQSKTEFAIQQLQRVRTDLVNNVSPVKLSYTDYVQAVFGELDQIIKELEGK